MAIDPYDAAAAARDLPATFARWRAWSDETRAELAHERDVRYGSSADETLDVFVPRRGAPLVVYFHGGYWRRLHKDDVTFIARGLAPHGVATALVNYGLAPAVPLEEITAQAQRAAAFLRERASDYGFAAESIVVAGHSAGGHLAAMCAVDAPVRALATISGLHELRAVARSHVNEWLQLDDERARRLSPVAFPPAAPCTIAAIVGQRESDAFKGQARAIVDAWTPYGCDGAYVESAGDDHYEVCDRLNDPYDPLTIRIANLALG
ncbi:esterase [Vulcanimicrobium alpinum]|uniref:Esterase n=1 Tax=Vulcanimicrobium alpinum TaxID=3016050 RepID=A0AAN2CA11_UNVUL|nr:alpha/beta hydrolase [Vulcanimicrobium alpinum]BDE07140.1 esterase [Vulcanimicrobium alpinum]